MPRVKRTFSTQEERVAAVRQRKKQYEKGRINLGQALEEWESERDRCGGSHADFALHLLVVHRTYCRDLHHGVQGPQQDGQQNQVFDFGVDQLGEQSLGAAELHRRHGDPEPLKQEATAQKSLYEDELTEQDVAGTITEEAPYIKKEPEEANEHQSLSSKEIPSQILETECVAHVKQTANPGWETEQMLLPSEHQMSRQDAMTNIRRKKKLHNKTCTSKQNSAKPADTSASWLAPPLNVDLEGILKHTVPPVKCMLCGEEFQYRHDMRRHVPVHKQETPYKCTMCDTYFTSQDTLKEHETVLCRKLAFTCGACGKIFKKKERLQEHELTHNKVETSRGPCICETCGKVYQSDSGLADHMYKHTGQWPHKCAVCAKGYTKICELMYHMASHSNLRPYSCQTCGKSFIRKNNFRSHQRVHKPDRPFKCSICGKEFKTKGVVQIHEQRHSEERNHHCTICGQVFKKVRSEQPRDHTQQ